MTSHAPRRHALTQAQAARARLFAGAALLAVALLSWSGCALYGFDESGFDLPITAKHTFEIPVELDALPQSGQPAPQQVEVPLPLPATPVDLTTISPDINANKDKLESIEITQITIDPLSNTVTADLPPIDIFIGPKGATTTAQGIKVATLPSVKAGSTTKVGGTIHESGMAAAQQYVTTLEFAMIPAATLVVQQGETVPSGNAVLEVTLAVTATVDPTK